MSTDDISLEPLFNQGGVGAGSSRKPGFVPIDTAGACDHRTPVVVTAVAQEITISTSKRSIEIQNEGDEIIYFGGAGVTSTSGIMLFPRNSKGFTNVQDTFSIYVVCAAALTATLRIVEYD